MELLLRKPEHKVLGTNKEHVCTGSPGGRVSSGEWPRFLLTRSITSRHCQPEVWALAVTQGPILVPPSYPEKIPVGNAHLQVREPHLKPVPKVMATSWGAEGSTLETSDSKPKARLLLGNPGITTGPETPFCSRQNSRQQKLTKICVTFLITL